MGTVLAHSASLDWTQLASDSGAGVLVLDTQGRLAFVNAAAARIFTRRSPREATGLRLADVLPGQAAAERLEVVRQVLATGDAILLHDLWAGVAMRCVYRKLDQFAEVPGPVCLIVCTSASALLEESGNGPSTELPVRQMEARYVDMGPLSSLTASELRVLALIGEGLSNADIAARLHRAVKTVESHRAALTDKTGSTSRVQLGVMARRAGLMRRLGAELGPGPVAAS